jgi:hypothetical protein
LRRGPAIGLRFALRLAFGLALGFAVAFPFARLGEDVVGAAEGPVGKRSGEERTEQYPS